MALPTKPKKADNQKDGATNLEASMEQSENSGQNSVQPILTYRTNLELRELCRREVEALEHWSRRLIHEILSAAYSSDYFHFQKEDGEPLFKKSLVERIEEMKESAPERYPRLIDATSLDDIISIICREDLYREHFKTALQQFYPNGSYEVRTFLERVAQIRNKLSHANDISIREAEQTICYCHDFIEGLKIYYKTIGKEREYNVPLFTKVIDSKGSVIFREDNASRWEVYDHFCESLHSGEIYRLELEIDPNFEQSKYCVQWFGKCGFNGEYFRQVVDNELTFEFQVNNNMVGRTIEINCRLTSNKSWHKYGSFDDYFSMSIYKILPPIEDNY